MKTMTFEEFFNKTDVRTLDKIIGHIRRNKKLYMQLVVIVAVLGLTGNTVMAAEVNTGKIEVFGRKMLGITRSIAYWVVLLKGLYEIIGHAAKGDKKGAFQAALTYILIFAVLFLFPMGLDMVKEAFS
jgi:hypothetical protein